MQVLKISPLRRAATLSSLAAIMIASASCADVLDIPNRTYDPNATTGADPCESPIGVRLITQGTEEDKAYFAGVYDYLRDMDEGKLLGDGCSLDIAKQQVTTRTEASQAYDSWKSDPSWDGVVTVFPFMPDVTDEILAHSVQDQRVVITGSPLARMATPVSIQKSVEVTEVTATFGETKFPVEVSSPAEPFSFIAVPDVSTLTRLAVHDLLVFGSQRIAFFYGSANRYTDRVTAGKAKADAISSRLGRDLILEDMEDPNQIKDSIVAYFQQEVDYQQAHPSYTPVDWVFCATYGNTPAIAQALAQVEADNGLHVGMVMYGDGLSESIASTCGASCIGRVNGVFGIDIYDGKSAGAQEARQLHDKWRERDTQAGIDPGATYHNTFYMRGVASAMMWRLGMEKLIASGRPATGVALKESLESLQQEAMRDLTGSITLSPSDHRPSSQGWVYFVNASKKLEFMPPSRSIPLEDDWLGW